MLSFDLFGVFCGVTLAEKDEISLSFSSSLMFSRLASSFDLPLVFLWFFRCFFGGEAEALLTDGD